MTLRIGPYAAVERPGRGHRAAGSVLWRGEDEGTGESVLLLVLPADEAAAVSADVEALTEICHPHLLPVDDVVSDAEHVAVVSSWPRGGRLLELLVRHGPLTAAETLTVLIPVASALATVHGHQIRHGGVGAGSIWFDDDGRPQLGAPAVARIAARNQHGMLSDSRDVAPEVVRGERLQRDPPGPAADVFSLGSVALFCLTGRSAWPADDPADVLIQSAAGVWPDPPDGAAPAALLDLIRAMLSRSPDQRPSAADAAQRLSAVGRPAPISFGARPAPAAGSADRWLGAVPTVPAAIRATRPPSPKPPDAASPGPPRSGPTRLARAGIAVLASLLVVVFVIQAAVWSNGGENPDAAPDWPQIVADLDAARGRALEVADPALLADVYLDGSAAAAADAALIAELAHQGWHVSAGLHEISSVTPVGPAPPGEPGSVRLAVQDRLPSRPIVDGSGSQVGMTPAREQQERIVLLDRTPAGYRIAGITDP
ncbi:serine/threonine protein kinase [Nakamurella sp. GG22]